MKSLTAFTSALVLLAPLSWGENRLTRPYRLAGLPSGADSSQETVIYQRPDKASEKPRLGDIPDVNAKGDHRRIDDPFFGEKETDKSRLNSHIDENELGKSEKKTMPALQEMTPEERKVLLSQVAEEFFAKAERATEEGRFEEAEDLYERVLTLQPQHAGARAKLAFVREKLEPAPGSSTAMTEQTDPKHLLTGKLTRELDQLMEEKNWDRADAVAKNIMAVDPADQKTKTKSKTIRRYLSQRAANRGAEREKSGDIHGAVDAYRLALSYSPDPLINEKVESLLERIGVANERKSDDLYLQALDASQAGKIEKALELCNEALNLNPKNIQAQRMVERLKARRPS